MNQIDKKISVSSGFSGSTTADNISKTILVIDNISETVELIVEYLHDSGYEIITAASCHEAIQLFQTHQPDLIISDVEMPDLDGLSMIKKLKTNYPALKAIMMTACPKKARSALGPQLTELGLVCMLEKPLNILELITTVHVLLSEYKQPISQRKTALLPTTSAVEIHAV